MKFLIAGILVTLFVGPNGGYAFLAGYIILSLFAAWKRRRDRAMLAERYGRDTMLKFFRSVHNDGR